MRRKLILILGFILILVLTSGTSFASPAGQQPQPITIPGSPLRIIVGANASMQIYHQRYASGQAYGEADSGIFFWVNGLLYGSNLGGTHSFSAANTTLPFTTLSHSGPRGLGTSGDPFIITTVLQVGDTGLEVEQKVSYVNGQDYFRIDWLITNRSSSSLTFDFFHAADLYFADSDQGYGYYDRASGGVGGADFDRSWYMMFVPAQPPTAYQEGPYSTIWANIGSCFDTQCTLGPGLDNTVLGDEYLDNGVGLQWHRSLGPEESTAVGDWWSFGTTPVVPPEAGGRQEFFSSIPTPLQISTDPAVIATNFALAGFFAFLFGILSTIFNNTLQENREEINKMISRWLPFKGPAPWSQWNLPGFLRFPVKLGLIAIFLVLFALINSFLDPAFNPFTLQGLGIFLSMMLSLALINLLYEGIRVVTAQRTKLPASFKLHPLGILVAMLCVLLSRQVEFLPGYLFGFIGGMALLETSASRGRFALISGIGIGAVLLVGLGSWLLTLPLGFILGVTASLVPVQVVLVAVQSLMLLIFLVALENAFFELLPLAVTAGSDIFTWNKIVWFLAILPVFFLFYHILLNPDGAYLNGLTNKNTLLILFLILVYGLLTLGTWLFFRMRRKG
ncbi:MAG: hypothetical protein HYX86_02655 [Chloroflexi bacterium]|nr:hypothetical protein [Chloroflexota bacterium]